MHPLYTLYSPTLRIQLFPWDIPTQALVSWSPPTGSFRHPHYIVSISSEQYLHRANGGTRWKMCVCAGGERWVYSSASLSLSIQHSHPSSDLLLLLSVLLCRAHASLSIADVCSQTDRHTIHTILLLPPPPPILICFLFFLRLCSTPSLFIFVLLSADYTCSILANCCFMARMMNEMNR